MTTELKFDGGRLRDMRIAKKMSQDDLAEKVGTTRVSLALWERGSHAPKLDMIGKLGDALGVSGTFFIKEG